MLAPTRAAPAASSAAPVSLIAIAPRSSSSAPSTFDQAAQLMTTSGRKSAIASSIESGIGDVELAAVEGRHVMAAALRRADHVLGEHAGSAGDQDPHARVISERSPTSI